MQTLRLVEKGFWTKYINTLADKNKPTSPFVEASFAGNKEITDSLIALYMERKKTAGSSVLEDFLTSGNPVPKPGNYWIILDSDNQPKCIVKTTSVVFNKFKDVSPDIAVAEGEGDLSLDYWRKVHYEFFKPNLTKWGIKNINEATIITEFVELVYK